MRLLHLYRPRLPGLRAQAIQVVHTAHALARTGAKVTLLADRGASADPQAALAVLGLSTIPELDLRICPYRHPGLAGLWFRTCLARWWAGPRGVVLARDKRRLAEALQWLPHRHRIVLETHELDSALAAEQGGDPVPWSDLERGLLGSLDALIANCRGTLHAWEKAYPGALPTTRIVAHNGTDPDRSTDHRPSNPPVIRVMGSLRQTKGRAMLRDAAPDLPAMLEIIGGTAEERREFEGVANIQTHPAVPYTEIPALLATSNALILPLDDNLFGRQLTSPLKLWDYLATTAPIIAADTPAVQEIAAMMKADLTTYPAGDAAGLVSAAHQALVCGARPARLRTWMDRATEVRAVLESTS